MVKFSLSRCLAAVSVVLLCGAAPLVGLEKVGTTSYQFLKVMTDARSTAMGEAYSAVARSSLAGFWNPAALTRVSRFDLAFSHTDWFLDATHYSFVAAYNLPRIGTFGLQGLSVDYGEIEETRVEDLGYRGDSYHPGLTGRILEPGANVIGLSFARGLTDKFSFGLTMKYASEDLVAKSTSTLMFDAGILYWTGYRSLRIAAAVRHFGPEVEYIDENFPLPQTFNLGIAGYLIAPQNSLLMASQSQSLLVAFDLVHPRDFDQQYNMGLEYSFGELIFIRGGYKLNYDTAGLCLGAGLRLRGISVDYSFNDYGKYLDAVHRFTIGASLD